MILGRLSKRANEFSKQHPDAILRVTVRHEKIYRKFGHYIGRQYEWPRDGSLGKVVCCGKNKLRIKEFAYNGYGFFRDIWLKTHDSMSGPNFQSDKLDTRSIRGTKPIRAVSVNYDISRYTGLS